MSNLKCDKVLENGLRLCHKPATLFYASSATGSMSARCPEHQVAAYKPELGQLLILSEEEYKQRSGLT